MKYNLKGITLVEIVFVVFLITILSSILISNFPLIQKRHYLNRSANLLAQDLRRAQDLSLSGFSIEDQSGNLVPLSGYGVYISKATGENDQYIIYADTCSDIGGQDFDFKYTKRGNRNCRDIIIGDGPVIFTKDSPGVFVKGFSGGCIFGSDSISIHFLPPNPKVTIYGVNGNCKEVNITLGLTSIDSETRVVTINKAGLITSK